MNEFMAVIKNYAGFTGRAGRREYWMFYLVYLVIYAGLAIASAVLPDALGSIFGILVLVFALGLLIPSIAVGVRRLHDSDRSGWWLLIALIPIVGIFWLLYLLIIEGTPESNRFGPSPVALLPNSV